MRFWCGKKLRPGRILSKKQRDDGGIAMKFLVASSKGHSESALESEGLVIEEPEFSKSKGVFQLTG